MSWIKLQTNIWDNPKIDYLAHEVGLPVEMAVGIVSRLWSWFDQYTEDGTTDKIGKAKVNRIIVTSVTQLRDRCHDMDALGVTQNFIECLKTIGWISENDHGGYTLPKWGEHNGATAKKRATDQKRQEKHRDTKEKSDVVTPVTQERDKSVTREDKIRVEEIREIHSPPKNVEKVESGNPANFANEMSCPSLERFLEYVTGNASMVAHQLTEDQWQDVWRKADAADWTTLGSNGPSRIQNWKLWADTQARKLKLKPNDQAKDLYNPFDKAV
jgi:hypothetical protein